MHERGLVSAEVTRLLDGIDGRVGAVTITMGPGADGDVMAAAWEQSVAGTALEAVPVTWTRARSVLRCFACGKDYEGDRLLRCPWCGGDGLVVEEAPEIHATAERIG